MSLIDFYGKQLLSMLEPALLLYQLHSKQADTVKSATHLKEFSQLITWSSSYICESESHY